MRKQGAGSDFGNVLPEDIESIKIDLKLAEETRNNAVNNPPIYRKASEELKEAQTFNAVLAVVVVFSFIIVLIGN